MAPEAEGAGGRLNKQSDEYERPPSGRPFYLVVAPMALVQLRLLGSVRFRLVL
jgi:hypothetical protein